MAMHTTEDKGAWVLYTYDNRCIYLTQDEYEIFGQIINPPKEWASEMKEVKYMTFEDGGFAISDIRSYEKNRGFTGEQTAITLSDGSTRPFTPEEMEKAAVAKEKMRQKLIEKGILPKPISNPSL